MALKGQSLVELGYKNKKDMVVQDFKGPEALFPAILHPVPFNFFDPAGFTKKLTAEEKARKLNIEINNGRLAMIGLAGFIAEASIPGSVPLLQGKILPYAGDVMQPFNPF